MEKIIKTFLYIIACALIFWLIANFYNGSLKQNTPASAFEWEREVSVYFIDKNKAGFSSCAADMPVIRKVINAETLGPGAIEVLIKGPTSEESNTLYSALNPATMLQKFEIRGGVAYVDFSESLNEGVAGSCNVFAIRSQIENTLKALPDIDSVVISVNGQTEGILEP